MHLNILHGDPFDVLQSFRTQLNVDFFMDIIIFDELVHLDGKK
jgi:hypothetical protein